MIEDDDDGDDGDAEAFVVDDHETHHIMKMLLQRNDNDKNG